MIIAMIKITFYDIMYMFHVIKKKKREREICD